MVLCVQEYTEKEAQELVSAIRNTIDLSIKSPLFKSDIVKKALQKYGTGHDGVVIRLIYAQTGIVLRNAHEPNPNKTLGDAVVDMALYAASEGGSITPASQRELDESIIELSIMQSKTHLKGTAPSKQRAFDNRKHGVMVVYGQNSGIILPHTALEGQMARREMLEEACKRANLNADFWMQPNIDVYKFEAQTFIEESPGGKVMELPQR